MGKMLTLLAVLVPLALSQVSFGAYAEDGRVTGTVALPDGDTVPDDAVLQVVLIDESDESPQTGRVLGQTSVTRPAGPPYRFDVAYDPAETPPTGNYALQAELSSGGRILFRSRDVLPGLAVRGAEPKLWLGRLATPEQPSASGLRLPASFGGDMPCADCRGVLYRLNLWPDGVFQLRRVWEGKNMQRDAIGRWSIDSEARVLTLRGGEEALAFEVLGADRLRLVTPVVEGSFDERMLSAAPLFAEFDAQLALRGLVTWTDDGASFVECLTGRSYPIREDGDYAALEHAYLAAGIEPGLPLMASFDGEIIPDTGPDGAGQVTVRRFVGVWPDEACERAMIPPTLRNTYWRIVRLGDSEISALPERREPSLILRAGEKNFSATAGCRALSGRFSLEDASLKFADLQGSAADCLKPVADMEDRLVGVLAATARWRIAGQSLELFDDTGHQLASLQAVYLY